MKDLLLKFLLGALWTLIEGFLRSITQARIGDQQLVDFVANMVTQVSAEHSTWTGEQKRAFVFQSTKNWTTGLGKDVKDSLINAVLELTVLKLKTDNEIV